MADLFVLDDVKNQWLQPLDLAISVACVDLIDNISNVLEIGVWKGSWSISILKNRSNLNVVGVDPYPNLGKVKTEMLERMAKYQVDSRFQLFESIGELSDLKFSFGMIHVDGEHSEKQTYTDLVQSKDLVSDNGIIIVDDVNVEWFPGVSSAMHKFMLEHDFRMFLTTKSKAYLAKKDFAGTYYGGILENDLFIDKVEIFQGHPFNLYKQSTKVFGQDVLIGRPKQKLSQ